VYARYYAWNFHWIDPMPVPQVAPLLQPFRFKSLCLDGLNFAGWTKKLAGAATISVGVHTGETAGLKNFSPAAFAESV
jgi:hypothetical protein